jgi:hypothetical protein
MVYPSQGGDFTGMTAITNRILRRTFKRRYEMKVLKKGRPQVGWSKEFTCTGKGNGDGGCGARLLVSAGDLYHTYSHHYDGSTDYYTTFTCPCCNVKTDVEVPSSVDVYKDEKTYLAAKEGSRRTNDAYS